jgi:hypothetical protein
MPGITTRGQRNPVADRSGPRPSEQPLKTRRSSAPASAAKAAEAKAKSVAADRASDSYERKAHDTSGAFEAIRARPDDPRVALTALETTEEVLREVGKTLLASDDFLKRAIVANPFILLNEGGNDWLREQNLEVIPAARRARLLRDPAVAAAVDQAKGNLAALPDLNPGMFDGNRRFFAEIVRNRLQPEAVDPRPTAVVIYPKDDWNGEFGVLDEGYSKRHRLMYYRVADDTEATRALEEATRTKPAELVLLGGHGEQQLMAFGADDPRLMPPAWLEDLKRPDQTAAERKALQEQLEQANEGKYYDYTDADLLRPLRDRIAAGGHLVLMSCSTGKGKRTGHNLANFMHRMFPQATVHAPTEPVSNRDLQWDESGRFVGTPYGLTGKEYLIGPGGKKPARSHDLRAALARGDKL